MKTLWLAALVIPAQLIHAQEVKHAPPTVAQCQADQRLWIDKLERPNLGVDVSYPELNGWTTEMLNCEPVDPANRMLYYNTASESRANQAMRLENYLLRHNLYSQFVIEDAQGKGRQ